MLKMEVNDFSFSTYEIFSSKSLKNSYKILDL